MQNKKVKLSFYERKADFLAEVLIKRLRANEFPFNTRYSALPERNTIPSEVLLPRGTREHALFLFYACNYMKRMDSVVAFRALTEVFKSNPEIFLPESFPGGSKFQVEKERANLSRILSTQGSLITGLKDIQRFWPMNSRKLTRFYGGDPRNIFYGNDGQLIEFQEFEKRLRNKQNGSEELIPNGFLGFQLKMVSMLAYFYRATNLVPEFLFPPPLDIHIIRILMQTNVFIPHVKNNGDGDFDTNYMSDNIKDRMGEKLMEYMKKRNICPVEFSAGLWAFGRSMCSKSPVTHVKRGKDNGRKTELFLKDSSRWPAKKIQKYEATCLRCPFKKVCTWSIPGAAYSKRGLVSKHRADKSKIQKKLHIHSMFTDTRS